MTGRSRTGGDTRDRASDRSARQSDALGGLDEVAVARRCFMKKLTDHMDGEIKKDNEIIEKRVEKLGSQMTEAGILMKDGGSELKNAGKERNMIEARVLIKKAGRTTKGAGEQMRKVGVQ